ncbi:MAG: dephospho-CoA kinase [Deltaproteobacteria bacterium]|nr:dephospho-CoA kinase [Deltaproteobacteria bacterium]
MKVIGLTGNIGCGKSVVARMFEELGARVIDADRIARLVVEPGESAWKEIVQTFGEAILNSDGTINRSKLGEIVFNDKEKREALNRITHPRIVERIKEVIEDFRKENVEVVIVEAALIVEKGGMKPLINDLIVVTADEETQIRRLIERNALSREEALSRIKSQMPLSEKVKYATYVIDNSGTLDEMRKQVEEVWKRIL